MAAPLFHLGNNTRYQKIDAIYSYILAAAPKAVVELISKHIAFAKDNLNGDALDFRLEEINKHMKKLKSGEINNKFWLMNSRTLETSNLLCDNLMYNLGMNSATYDDENTQKNHNEIISTFRLFIRSDKLMSSNDVKDLKLIEALKKAETVRKNYVMSTIFNINAEMAAGDIENDGQEEN